MRAAQINQYGGPEVLKTVNDTPKPKAGAGQVLVEVYAAAVNPFDWKLREGYMKDNIPLQFPATLGSDLAGKVVELGEGVDTLAVGDEVYGQANGTGGQGSFAEFAPARVESLAAKPKSVDFVTASALSIAGVSAYMVLVEHAHVQSGQKVLIHGGAGGIGSFAVQLAKHLGAYVAATASGEDIQFAKNLGADEVIDYKTQDFSTLLKDYDMVLDTVGGETYTKSFAVLKPGGIIVSMVHPPDEELAQKHQVTAVLQATKPTPERLAKLAELVDAGAIKVQIDKVFPLEQAGEALGYIQAGHHHGKVVISVK